jgi:hypothetical protein
MRRLAVALSFSLVVLTLIPAAASARGPQKNDSVNGHGFVVYDPTTTYEFRVSAHTISSTTTAATGNMFITATFTYTTGAIETISIWADVYCVSVQGYLGQVRGHVYRTEPSGLYADPTDLVFDASDYSSFSNLPDTFNATAEAIGTPCIDVPPGGLQPVAKGDITVNDEGP